MKKNLQYIMKEEQIKKLIIKENKMSSLRGKQILLNQPCIDATKKVIRERLKGEQDMETYLRWYKDYFSFRSFDVVCTQYKNINQALTRLSNIKIYIDGQDKRYLEKVRGGKGCWSYFVFPKEKIIELIDEVKKENNNKQILETEI